MCGERELQLWSLFVFWLCIPHTTGMKWANWSCLCVGGNRALSILLAVDLSSSLLYLWSKWHSSQPLLTVQGQGHSEERSLRGSWPAPLFDVGSDSQLRAGEAIKPRLSDLLWAGVSWWHNVHAPFRTGRVCFLFFINWSGLKENLLGYRKLWCFATYTTNILTVLLSLGIPVLPHRHWEVKWLYRVSAVLLFPRPEVALLSSTHSCSKESHIPGGVTSPLKFCKAMQGKACRRGHYD